ncbi:prohibitin family protein [uncultured Bradyrhizobium sp.]|uniref:prohibitin family protein n=1 Tax=uncultured Bradyrhizobium sp. TaxID=199684 RepID=UPI0035CC0D88
MTDTARAEPEQPKAAFHRWWRRFKRWYWERRRTILLVVLVGLFALVMLAPYVLITVPSGHLGVLWLRFFGGTVVGEGLDEGLHPIFPWDRIYIYDARLKQHSETYDVVSRDGLSLQVEVTFRWRLLKSHIGGLHRDIGPNYLEVLLIPEVGSVAREVIARYDWQALASSQRLLIQQGMLSTATGCELGGTSPTGVAPGPPTDRASNPFLTRLFTAPGLAAAPACPVRQPELQYVGITDILIRSVILPASLRLAIERKLEQSQVSLEYDFRILREVKESERKAIEAQGIAAFQRTVQSGISETYLKWRGIEATLELARSPNSKVVVIGGNNGLPIILNTGDEVRGGPAAAPSAPKADLPPPALPPNQPGEPPPGPNVSPTSPPPPLSTAPPDVPAPAPTPAPPRTSPLGGANLIEQLGTTLSNTFGWNSAPPPR